jgi:PAS domain S-box-containing protein
MPTILRYGTAVLSVAIANGLAFLVLRHFEAILTPFLFAVAATVWYAGTGPGVLAVVLSVLSLNYFFLRAGFSFSPISSADLVYLTFCVFCALAVGWVSAVRRRTEQELRQAHDELEAKVLERTANLQRSESYLAETQKLTRTGSWAWDARSQKVLYCSEEMFRIYGLDPQVDLPTRKNFRQRVHPEDRSRTDERFVRVVREKVDSFDKYRVLLPDGTVKHVNSSGHPVLDENGEFIAFIGTATDVTERKRAEEALREREAKIRRLVDSNIIGIFFSGLEGRVLEANEAFLHLVGQDRDELVSGRVRWTDLTPPEWRERDRRALTELSKNTIAQPYEKEFFRKDGSRVPVLIGGALFEEGGDEGVAFVLDLTERKRAEQALMRSEAYLAQALKLTRTGSWVWDPRTEKVLFCSEEMFRIFGLDPRESLPSRDNFRQQIHPEDRDWVKKKFEESLRERVDTFAEYRVLLPDGTVRHINASGHLVLNEDGELIEFVGTATDVTERKRAEEALRESEAKIRRLVDSNIIGIFVWDFDGRVLEANDEFLRMVNYDREDLVSGRIRWTDLTPSDWRERDNAKIEQQKISGRLEPFEKEYTRKDGHRVPVLIGVATFEEGGNEGVAFVLDLTERKRAEEKSRESELKLRQIIETIPGLVWSNGPDGEATHGNQRMLDYSGMQLEEFRRRGWEAFVHPADYPGTAEAFRHAIQTGTSYQGVMRLRRADGDFRWHHARCEPLRDRRGNIIQWYGLCFDIDEGKKAEDLLRRSEAHLAEAQRLSHTGAVAYNGTAILFASEETYHIWGFDPARGLPSREVVFDRIHPGDRDWLSAEVRRAVGEKRRFSIAYRILLPDGTVKHLETIGQPLFSASGKLVEIFATQTDVTERKRAEQALQESETKFRDYAESASDWYWETDPDHKFTRLTEDERRLALGLATVSRIGVTRWEFATDVQSEPEKWKLHWSMLKARQPFRDFIYRATHSDGSVVYNRISGKPVFDSNGEFRGYRGTGTDVTALRTAEGEARENEQRYRKAELELVHANRVATMGQLTASITHEVNQPITAAVTYALAARRWLSAEPPNFREVDDALSLIVKEGNRAGDVVGRIRALIKKAPVRKEDVEINDAILEVIALTRTEAANNSVSVRTQLAEGLPRVQGDRVQLQQVLLNLIINAIDAMRDVGEAERELFVSTRNEPDGVSVEVRDSGPGFAPAALERVFEAFYTTKPDGLGLGLSICRSIIEAHNGRLWANPNVPRGAIFGFIAPVRPAVAS